MSTAKKFALVLALVMLLSASNTAYSASSYHYALTDRRGQNFTPAR